jgi:hypothetical protein
MHADVKKALEESIEHWEKMVACAEKLPAKDIQYKTKMEAQIGVSWSAHDCNLCRMFLVLAEDSNAICVHPVHGLCPLAFEGEWCFNPESLWRKVNSSLSWGGWLENAQDMLACLKGILEEADEDKL